MNNPIKTCIEMQLGNESYAKFQQVLDYIGEGIYIPLYKSYDGYLVEQLKKSFTPIPDGFSMQNYASLKLRFYAFRYISDIGKLIRDKYRAEDKKAEENYITLIKILLFHGLTSKTDTANLALVELQHLCVSRQITLQDLYFKHRAKFLRLIIKAILYKLSSDGNTCDSSSSTDDNSSGTGDNGFVRPSRSNSVIIYMTRALEIFNVTTITKEDLAQSLIISTNLIHKEKYNNAIKKFLDHLARYQNIDMYTQIRSHIQAIVVSLLLRRKLSHFDMTASLAKLCSFCDKSITEILATKFTFIKGRLLLHYSIDAKSVTDGIYYLSKFEKSEADQPFEDELDDETSFIDYINPSMIGILLGVDAHFSSTKNSLGSEESIMHIQSLCKLLSILNEVQVQAIHVKLLSTLSLLLRLRPRRDNQVLNRALRDLWSVFVLKLSKDLKISLLINICVTLYDLVEDCPEDVADIYQSLLRTDDVNEISDSLKTLFFIPNIPPMSKIYSYLTPYVRREDTVSNLQELQQSLDCALPLLKFENQRCRSIALMKIKQLLQSNSNLLISDMLRNPDEHLDILISKTIESLLALSSTQDTECSALIAECLGLLCAINPIRLDHLIYGDVSGSKSYTNLSDPSFIVDLIERLKNSLFSDRVSESETANYALQVVVKTFLVFKDSRIGDKLSEEAKRACKLCQNTNYSGTKKPPSDTSLSVYEKFKIDCQYSYREWLDKFSLNLISSIADKKVQEVLFACSYVFKHNLKLAEYLLPHAILSIIINQPSQQYIIKREIMAILDEDVGVSTQDLDTVYSEDVRGNIQTLHFQCANMIFCALDAIYRIYWTVGNHSSMPSLKLGRQQVHSIKDFVSSIPKERLGILASKCRSHARALYYFGQYLFDNKHKLDEYATALQRIYVALDDTWEATGIEMVRTTSTDLNDDIANYEACGRFDRAFICCSTSFDALTDNIDRESCIDDSLRCLSNQGDYHRLYEKSKQLISEHSQFKRNILPYAIEASWKLGKWDELGHTFKNEQTENLLESSCVSQGHLLLTLLENVENAPNRLKIVRNKLMKPLSIAIMDHSAYFRGYQNLLVLHSLEDFALSLKVVLGNPFDTQCLDENSIDIVRESLSQKLNSLFDFWNKRNKLVQPSLQSVEPLLEWQRSISHILAKKYPFLSDKINVDVGSRWLASADAARESRSFDRAFYCLTQAQRWLSSKFDNLSLNLRNRYHIEKAKLDWDQGEQTRAIRSLKQSWEKLKDHQLYKHLCARQEKNRRTDPFPLLNNMRPCSECSVFDQSERESFAEIRMLLTHYCEEACACIPEALFYMYEECVHLGVNQEETYFRLARYYDKLLTYYMENPKLCVQQSEERNPFDATQRFSQNLMSGDKDEVYTKLMEHSIIAFGNSLKYGVRYLYESMPRLLNIWYDLGSKKCGSKVGQPQVASRAIGSRIESTVRFIDELKKGLPPYYFMSAMSILLSRVTHPHSGVSKKTCEILELLLINYPHQITWLMTAMCNDTDNDDRKKAAKQILLTRRKDLKLEKVIKDTLQFSRLTYELGYNHCPHDKNTPMEKKKQLRGDVNLSEISSLAAKFDFANCKVVAPIQDSLRAVYPMDNDSGSHENHVVFPAFSFVRALGPKAKIFSSLQQPRMISLLLENGRTRYIICKSGDDLRKDSRCIEFLNLLNKILRRNRQSNARFLQIQTFLVLPTHRTSGTIEMVPNCVSLKNVLETLYKERTPGFNFHDPGQRRGNKEYTPAELLDIFQKTLVPKSAPPLLPAWFLRKFNEPTAWYMARLAYTRTSAVISMGGYILGLGDRHLDNILIDECNGRIVHVDFNLIFHQAESLPTPETVPFRLTQNIIAAMGSMGVEGNFRKVSEITMRVMRKEGDALLTTLKPIMYDPCSDWVKVRDTRGNRFELEDKNTENRSAKHKVEVIERKLRGYPRSHKFKPLTLIDSYSVEAQVDNLIEEASDPVNLSQMYFGWCPQI